ncbi:MAG: hypothetical protein KAR38_15000 [Calditrichia bacterium]|nr:hypothetical protein [Calditrichia bacterium]
MEFLIPISLFVIIAVIVNIITERNTERMKLKIIERAISEEKYDANLKELFEESIKKKETLSHIKWGIILIGLGLALIIGQFIPFFYDDKATLSLMFILSGIALIIYHFVFYKKGNE